MCSEDNVDVHDIELMQYINVDCSKLKRLLQGKLVKFLQIYIYRCSQTIFTSLISIPELYVLAHSVYHWLAPSVPLVTNGMLAGYVAYVGWIKPIGTANLYSKNSWRRACQLLAVSSL